MKRALTYFIVGLHLFFFCSFVFGSYLPKKKHRIAVHSVRLKTPPPVQQLQTKTATAAKKPSSPATAQSTKAPQPQPQQLPSTRPMQKKKPSSTTTTPNTAKKKEVKTVKRSPAVSQKLIKELEESIAKIDEKPDKFKSEKYSAKTKSQVQAPIVLNSLESEPYIGPFSERATLEDLRELLVLELKNSLHLPDFGEVTMRLVLRRDGSVAEVKVLKSASKKNSEYLERELPKHSFSFVAELGLKDNERNFVITFCNEI